MTTKRQQGYRVTLSLWLPVNPANLDDTILKAEAARDLRDGIGFPAGVEIEKAESTYTSRQARPVQKVDETILEPMPAEQALDVAGVAEDEPATVTRLRATA